MSHDDNQQFGLIFKGKTGELVYLGIFPPDGEITQFRGMRDRGSVFTRLLPHMFALVQVTVLDEDGVRIQDLGRVQMGRPIQEIISEDRLGPVTFEIWKTVVSERQFERVTNVPKVAMSLDGPPPGTRLN